MKKLLTLGIPTYNDAENIVQVLNKIKDNHPENLSCLIEILIIDNASTDNTEKVVSDYIKQNQNLDIRYYLNSKNIGGKANCWKVAREAQGEYLWLICDDLLYPTALKDFEAELIRYNKPDMMQMGTAGFEGDENNFTFHSDLKPDQIIENFDGKDVCFSMFIGNLILKTSLWQQYSHDKRCTESSYPHTWLAMRAFSKSRLLFLYEKIYIKQRLVRRDQTQIPLRTLHETILTMLNALNDNQDALGDHFKRVELLIVKFLSLHHIKHFKHQLKTIPTRHAIRIFFQIFSAIRFRRKQLKLLGKVGFWLFQPCPNKSLSKKDEEYLKLGDKANSSNKKIS